ncbi:hypothetical protein TPE_0856 [Treponema pedis str. T A4]|uniref:Uncharacterized protein n=1 Tax=Treponema pedis str. T A4 TaxID=1291379 RepID=S5ZL99_9SPIR|nr:hypothetical protein TPE_0856 [Treponema pedis str. T A4]
MQKEFAYSIFRLFYRSFIFFTRIILYYFKKEYKIENDRIFKLK